jgi:photosystem II stability/assembly factor-like uncharacterized protein
MPRPFRAALSICAVILLALAAVPTRAADDDAKDDEASGKKKGRGPAEYESLKYRLVGPAVGGRVSRVAGVAGNPLVAYAATASGGVWKSEDGGITWKSIWDDQPISSIGSIAVAPSNPNVIYVGSGEANIRGNVAAGNGIYKSNDAGKSWQHVWIQEGQIGTMVVHPSTPDIAFAAVLGHAFGPNPERGVYRTKDGGKTWQQVLKKDNDTGASDVCIDPSNPSIVFAGFWQARRTPWGLTSAGPGSGLYGSKDGGDTWKQLKKGGLPDGIWGKVGCAVAPSDGRRVYALIEADKGGLYRSDDGGDSWSLASDHHAIRQRPWYYSTMTVDPTNPDVIWFPQVPLLRSIDGGHTVKRVRGAHHGDNHDIWIDPKNPKRVIDGNDGGIDLTWNGGETWYTPEIPIAQFYHVSVDSAVPYHVAGAMQDLGTAQGPSDSLAEGGITSGDWWDVGGGEAGHTASDPSDPDVVYAGEYMGIITRYDHKTGNAPQVSAFPDDGSGHGADWAKYRFQWTAPIATSPHDPKVVYHGGNVLLRSQDGGQTWAAISPDLTRNDKAKQGWSGGPVTGDNTGAEWYCTIFAIAESPKEKGLIWVGSDDGLVHVTRDGGQHWTDATPKGAPEWGTVDLIEPSSFDAATAYVVFDNHRMDDTRPYLYKTTDYGRSWKSVTGNLPKDVYLHAVREDPKARGFLWAGTERGVAFSRDDGANWTQLGLNLPTVAVHDLVRKNDDLVLATHGRSIWILDNVTAIRDGNKEILGQTVHLFPVQPAVRWEERSAFHDEGPGENPPRGAVLYYSLKEKQEGDLRLDILDDTGKVVRTITSKKEEPEVAEDDPDGGRGPKKEVLSKDPGVQRVVWNLRVDPAMKIKGAKVEGNPEAAPRVAPGTYQARLTVGKDVQTTSIEVRPDPRLNVSPQEIAAQVKFAQDIQAQITRLSGMVTQIRLVRAQLSVKSDALRGNATAADWLKQSEGLIARCDALEAKLHNPKATVEYDILAKGAMLYSRLATLLQYTLSGTTPPTQGQREVFAAQRNELDQMDTEWRSLLSGDIATIAKGADALAPGGIAVPAR